MSWLHNIYFPYYLLPAFHNDWCGLSQWKTTLHCNVVFHWLSPHHFWRPTVIVCYSQSFSGILNYHHNVSWHVSYLERENSVNYDLVIFITSNWSDLNKFQHETHFTTFVWIQYYRITLWHKILTLVRHHSDVKRWWYQSILVTLAIGQ